VERPQLRKATTVRHNTMKIILTIFLQFFYSTFYGQTNIKVFITTTFNENGQILEIDLDSIYVDTLNFEFYLENFGKPYQFPSRFHDNKFKNQTIKIWEDSTKLNDFYSNWNNEFHYDSLSRLTHYGYSGCITCSRQTFLNQITYDNLNRPIKFSITENHSIEESKRYQMTYDKDNNIIKIEYYVDGILFEQIERM
jgi:hypothetical protein